MDEWKSEFESDFTETGHVPGDTARACASLVSLAIVVAAVAAWYIASDRANPRIAHYGGMTMGTHYNVSIAAPLPSATSGEGLQAELDRRLEAVNDWMSTYRPDSEVSKFNRSAGNDWYEVSPETARVVAEAQRISELTGGAFDVTVGPLVNLWSFGPDKRPRQVPSAEDVEAAKQLVGYQQVDIRTSPPALRKLERDDLSIDLSGIAKGFGVDLLADYLDEIGVSSYLVDIGGEMRARGRKPDGAPWRAGIERPAETPDAPGQVLLPIDLLDRALATSGDYRNYFESDGTRYSHTIDPRTGRPIEFDLASVSVLHESCMTADALATALMVLGADGGYNFAVDHDLAVLFVVRTESGFEQRATPEFEKLTGQHPAPQGAQ